MTPDLIFVLGCVLAVLSIPAIVSAFADGRRPRVAALTILIGGGMIIYAMTERPGAYTLETLPDIFAQVVSQVIN